MGINYIIVGLVLLAGHVCDGEYLGGSMRYVLSETNNSLMAHVTILTGWRLGTGPCGHQCSIGQTTSSQEHQITASLGQDHFGRWITEEKGPYLSRQMDITEFVNNNIQQRVMDINRMDNWEIELGTFSIPVWEHSTEIVYFQNNMTKLTVQTAITRSYMEMKINLPGNRSDTGMPNRSPITDSRPFMRLALGRKYHLRVPTVDPDQDFVSCRPPRYVEFLELFESPAPNVTINKDCTIDVYADPSHYKIGDTALVGIVVEDFPRKQVHIGHDFIYVDGYSLSLSQTPVQFYFEVTGSDDSPVILPPTPPNGQLFTVYQGTKLTIEVFAKPSVNNRIISNFRYVSNGIARHLTWSHIQDRPDIGALVKSQQIVWIPSADMIGSHSLCVIAQDSDEVDSVSNYCFAVEVKGYPTSKEELTPRPGVPYFVNFPQPGQLDFPVYSQGFFPIYAASAASGSRLHIKLTNTSSNSMMITSIDNGSNMSIVTVLTYSAKSGNQDVCFQIEDVSSPLERCTNVHFITADPCERIPCKNSGICVRRNTEDKFTCHCERGYTGATCEIGPDPCASQPCKNGGTCLLPFRSYYKCICPLGKTGYHCDNEIINCRRESCKYGVCEDNLGSGTCHCAKGFTGTQCTEPDSSTALCPGLQQNATDCIKQCNWCYEPHGICRPSRVADQYDECTCSLGYEKPGTHCFQGNNIFVKTWFHDPKFVPPTPGPLSTISCELDQYTREKCSFPVYAASYKISSIVPAVESLFPINGLQVTASSPIATSIQDVYMYNITVQQSKENNGKRNKYDLCLKVAPYGNITARTCVNVIFTNKGENSFVEPTLPNDSNFTCTAGRSCHMFLYTETNSDQCERIIVGADASVEIFSPELRNGACVTDVAIKLSSVPYQRLCLRAGLGGESRCYGVILDSGKDTCTDTSCKNDGVCVSQAGKHFCICPPNYSGNSCELYEGPCLSSICQERGLCYQNITSINCLCQIGYSGDKCQYDILLTGIHTIFVCNSCFAFSKSIPREGLICAFFSPGAFPIHVTCFMHSKCFMNTFITSTGSSNFSVSPGYTDVIHDEISAYLTTDVLTRNQGEVSIGVLMIQPTTEGRGRTCLQIRDSMSGSIDEMCFIIDILNGETTSINKIFPYFETPTPQNNTIFECFTGSACHIMIWTHKADGEVECPNVQIGNRKADTIGTIVIQNTTSTCVIDVTLKTQDLSESTDICLTLRPKSEEREIYERGIGDRRCYSIKLGVNNTATSPCSNFLCYNGGYCDSQQGVPDCLCRQGFSGQQCQLVHPGVHMNTAANRRVNFADDAFPSNIVCQLEEKCSFIVNLWSPSQQTPNVWFDHIDDSIIAEQPNRNHTIETSPGIYAMTITVNGTRVGTFETILQTSDNTGLVSDELWFRYDIRTGSSETLMENQPHFTKPSFPAESAIICSNERMCHIILLSESAAFEQCPHVELLGEPRDSIYIFQEEKRTVTEYGSCVADVALLASNKQLAIERFCFRLSLPTVPGETRCYRVQYGSAVL
ncbi:uncharacterized protein LOC132549136 [Ylistrum balloti]|uniref:uncharacterized protein LOC132549136 n=1 Tax=Ylistrum balloti TaxID=509963 RepID=UPI002905B921|nr:uncharacterized protein LOC132549136 [Ylistrum balloti]